MDLKKYIKDVKDFPIEGIIFRDITPLMADGAAYQYANLQLAKYAKDLEATVIVGPEARGFVFGCPVAHELNVGFIPVRKPGKLPRETLNISYDLEYGSNNLSIHKDDIKASDRVVIIDDLLATGGTLLATIKLVEQSGAKVVGIGFLIELEDLKGRELLKDYNVFSLLKY